MIVDPGKLQHYCSIYAPIETDTPDGRGDEQLTYGYQLTPPTDPTYRAWCSIEPVAGRELMLAMQMHGNITHKITMRYIAGITKRHVLRWSGRTFNLSTPLDTETQQYQLQVYATERV